MQPVISSDCTWAKRIILDDDWKLRLTANEKRQIGVHNEGVKTRCRTVQ